MDDEKKSKQELMDELDVLRKKVEDITERKQTEQLLREREAELATIYENAPLIMLLVDKEWRIKKANVFTSSLTGRSVGDMVDLRCGEALCCIHALDTREGCGFGPACKNCTLRLTVIDTIETGRSHCGAEVNVLLSDGGRERNAVFLISTTKLVIKGQPTALLSIQDVSERKRTEETLWESMEQYRAIFENTVEGILMTGPDGKIYTANPAACHMFLRSEEEICRIGRDGLVVDAPQLGILLKERREKGKARGELAFVRKDGTKFIGECSSAIFTDKSGRERTSMIIRDVTVQKVAEQKLWETTEWLNALIEAIPDLIFFKDEQGRYLIVNKAFEEKGGIERKDIIGKTDGELFPPEVVEQFLRSDAEVIKSYKPFRIDEYMNDTEVGKLFLDTIKFPLLDDRGVIRGIGGIGRDITERKRLEEILKKEKQELKLIIDSSPIIIFYKDKEGKFIRVNKKFAGSLKMPEEEFMGKTVFDFYSSNIAQYMTNDDQEVLQSGSPKFNIVEQYESASGIRWVQTDKIPICDNNDIPIGIVGFAQDITERKQVEEALQLSEERFSTVFRSSPVAIAITRLKDNQFIDVNESWEQITGYEKEEAIGRTPIELNSWVHPKEREILIGKLREGGTVQGFEFQMRNKSGNIVDLLLSAELIKTAGDACILTMAIDITELKTVEGALRQAYAYNRSLIEASLDPLVTIGADGRITDVNSATEAVTGYTRTELIGTEFSDYFTDPEQARSGYQEVFREGFVHDYPLELRHRNGHVTSVLYNASVYLDDKGQILGVFAAARDVTDRKIIEDTLRKSEEQYRSLVESTKDSIYLLDKELRYLFANNAYLKRVGLTRQQLIGRSYSELHPFSNDTFPGYVNRVFETGESTEFEYKSFRDDKPFLRTLSPVIGEQGEIIAVTVLSKDVTRIKEVENALRKYQFQLRNLMGRILAAREEERLVIAREIHDELGGALTGLKIDLSYLASTLPRMRDTAKRNSFVNKLKDMTNLIDETIHTVRRIIMDIRPSILDDFGLVAAIEWQAQEFQKRTGIECEYISDLEDISLDEQRSTAIFRIFQESLTNVLRHAAATKVTVILSKEADHLILKVADNGKGITKEKVSDPKSLGLLGIRERALLLRGTVGISGEPWKGTTVSMKIPLDN